MAAQDNPSDITEFRPSPIKDTTRWKKTVDVRMLAGILALLLILLVFFIVKSGVLGSSTKDRKIRVTGEASVSGTPDEFVFYPSYTVRNSDRSAALKEIASKSSTVTAGLKDLGVTDSQIKSGANGYTRAVDSGATSSSGATEPAIAPDDGDGKTGDSYGLQFTITITNRGTAQKVQDYLATTGSVGVTTPISNFSAGKRKQLESKARDEATKDARSKAEQSANNLGFKIGAVKTVSDGSGFSESPVAKPALDRDSSSAEEKDDEAGGSGNASGNTSTIGDLEVQPGTQTLSYSVTVEYYVR